MRLVLSQSSKGNPELKRTSVKAILLCCMTADHIAMMFKLPEPFHSIFLCIGMICMPLYSLFLAEGFERTKNRGKYGMRILLFAVISHFAFKLAFPGEYPVTSAMATLFLSFLLLCVKHSAANKTARNLMAIGLVSLSLLCDWGLCAPLWVVAFDRFKEKGKMIAAFLAIGLGYTLAWSYIMGPSPYIYAFVLATPFICIYNGRQGKSSPFVRRIFYIYYPLHLFALSAVRTLTQM